MSMRSVDGEPIETDPMLGESRIRNAISWLMETIRSILNQYFQ